MNSDFNDHPMTTLEACTQHAQWTLIAFTEQGIQLSHALKSAVLKFDFDAHVTCHDKLSLAQLGGVKTHCQKLFEQSPYHPQIIVFICATGIAVRSIAPFVKDKLTDPAVIVIDDYGQFVISLLSGHVGNANKISHELSNHLQSLGYIGTPVITTATDTHGIEGFESVFKHYKIELQKNRHDIKTINMAIVSGHKIGVLVDPFLTETGTVTCSDAVIFYTDQLAFSNHIGIKIVITVRMLSHWFYQFMAFDGFTYYSKSLVLGTGCRKDVLFEEYEAAFQMVLNQTGISPDAIHTIASVKLKEHEKCILELANRLHAVTSFFSTEFLTDYTAEFETSVFVKKTIGIGAVAGPSAYAITKDKMTFEVYKGNKCTFSIGRLPL